MFRKTKTAILSLSAALGLLAFGVTTAEAKSIHVAIEAPVVIGDQAFSGEKMTFKSLGQGSLLAVEVDGRRVAVVEKPSLSRYEGDDRLLFSFLKDSEGLWHLCGVKTNGSERVHEFRVAAVAEGDLLPVSTPSKALLASAVDYAR